MDRPSKFVGCWLWLLLLGLFAAQVRWPQLAYPATGVLLASGLALCLTVAGLRHLRALQGGSAFPSDNPAAWAGAAFLLYAWARWALDGFPALGSDSLGTLLVLGGFALTGYLLLAVPPSPADDRIHSFIPASFHVGLGLLALGCGAYALAQYVFLYDRSYRDLQAELAGRIATPTEAALLYHFQLRRVASVWGDPNAFAAFCAATLPASLWLAGRARAAAASTVVRMALVALGLSAGVGALVGVALSGSRGGILDCLMVLGAWAVYLAWARYRSPIAAAGICLSLFVFVLMARPSHAQFSPPEAARAPVTPSAWTWRSSTIQERLYYLQVGKAMVAERPVFGMGLGSVDLYFGRYKPPEAREARYLHNWVLQIAAELGLVGVALAGLFILLLFARVLRNGNWRQPLVFPSLAGAGVLTLDGLVQLSFNQRELMALFGLFCALLLHAGAAPARSISAARVRTAAAVGALVLGFLFHLVPRLAASNQRDVAEELLEVGEWELARRQVRRAQAISPRDPSNALLLASIEEAQGNLPAARMHLQAAIRLQPESASAHASLARLLQRQGDFAGAETELQEALKRYPSNWRYHDQMSQLEQARGNEAKACEHARLAHRFAEGLPGTEGVEARLRELGCTP